MARVTCNLDKKGGNRSRESRAVERSMEMSETVVKNKVFDILMTIKELFPPESWASKGRDALSTAGLLRVCSLKEQRIRKRRDKRGGRRDSFKNRRKRETKEG